MKLHNNSQKSKWYHFARSGLNRYVFTIIMVVISYSLRVLLTTDGDTVHVLPYVTYFSAVTISALYGGWTCGVLATLLATVLIFWVAVRDSMELITRSDIIGLIVFIFSGILTAAVAGMMSRYQTQLKRLELAASANRFLKLFNEAPLGIALIESQTGNILEVNPKFASIVGRTALELEQLNWMSITHPDDVQSNLEYTVQLNAGAIDGFQMEKRYIHVDGSEVWINLTVARMCVADCEQPQHLCMIEDITKRKLIETALRQKVEHFRALFEERFNQLAELSRTYHWEVDGKGLFTYISYICKDVLGYGPQEIVGCKYLYDLCPEAERAAFQDEILRIFSLRDNIVNMESKLNTREGRSIWVLTNAVPLRDDAGNYIGYSGTSSDITNEKTSREELENFFNVNLDLLCIADVSGKFIKVNKSWETILGYSVDKLQKRTFLEFVHPDDLQATYAAMAALANQDDVLSFTNRYRSLDGSYRYIEWRSHPVGKLIYAAARDVTERKANEERIGYLSFHDVLTGLYNRRYFEEELRRSDTARQLPISIIIGDVNNLKMANDVFGHEQGDAMIVAAAQLFKSCCRDEDRYGGDEFVVFLPQCTEATVAQILERVQSRCKAELVGELPLSLALGNATKSGEHEDLAIVLSLAETRMYKNKLTGDNRVRYETLVALERLAYAKDYHTEEHSTRMRQCAIRFGEYLQLEGSVISEIALLATLHDVGKVTVSEQTLNKQTPLTDAEWEEIKIHASMGAQILGAIRVLDANIAKDVLAHHEHWDGSGYPKSLQAEAIPFASRFIALIDAYDVMTHERPYHQAMTSDEAITELLRCSGTQFDPQLVEKFIEFLTTK